jgi:transcriptional regulator with XRE-family HTH domain
MTLATPAWDLGLHLKELRNKMGWSLREVEARTNGVIHNAYLSQIESGRVKSPSVMLLGALAEAYRVDLLTLMHRAGWVPADGRAVDPTPYDLLPRALFEDLSPDEVDEVVEYVHLIKRRRRNRARRQRGPGVADTGET